MQRTPQTLWALLVIPLAWGVSLSCSGCQSEAQHALWQAEEPAVPAQPGTPAAPSEPAMNEPVTPEMQAAAIQQAVAAMLRMEEGPARGEWPYEGVYRVRRQIPIGYRVGGTAIVCEALLAASRGADDTERIAAIQRGVGFVLNSRDHPLMSPEYDGGYDVRGWGYTASLSMLTLAMNDDRLEETLRERVRERAEWYAAAVVKTEIPTVGGWNYARRPGIETVSPPSSFMTAMTIMALLDAKEVGLEIDQEVLQRAITFLEASRAESGEYVYSGTAAQRRAGGVPGATGRMLVSELALERSGRGDLDRVRSSLDAFVEHWDELEKRRAKPGTHEPPYGVAPYYFYFAHRYAAEAVELLPENERQARRALVLELLWRTRNAEDGTWNDRVFPRSASYGTAMSALAILAPDRMAGE